ncbi:glycine cleavage system aminomethyltransferase GcvT [Halapricum sp. CBA1109]|uniref:glycine cleavage system aminomethyltransferase GcvT n=1 Tax=Halapricum sp. CBA1109 TaxID=2668068 RepID=UPI0012FB96EA|nr:glycine cleavage system aminomethyltransferase GcvT [Halapricum sp. CBA1109]MUV89896.1 glycine cleavage system aminomethyltransferase GcvT [Halapricum sp. CBA1109]
MTRRTPLADSHGAAGARTTEFGGWEMPVEFDSIRTEHEAVRAGVGKFDVSHMGQIDVTGPNALDLINRLTTNDVGDLEPGEAHYSTITDEDGVVLDDTVVYALDDGAYRFVPNAGHDAEMAERCRWLADKRDYEVTVTNATEETGMIAVQGPEATDHFETLTDRSFEMGRFEIEPATIAGVDCRVASTGYTGERGFEILCPAAEVGTVWNALDCQPCGLGARDTLRLEMGFVLSGQEFDPESRPRTPYDLGLDWVVDLDTTFVGRDALEAEAENGPDRHLTGLRLIDRGVARHGHPVTTPDGEEIGSVTSGTMSPTLGEAIALVDVAAGSVADGDVVRVVVRDEPKKARIRTPPFLDR